MHNLLSTEDMPLLGDDELSGMSQGELDILVSMLDGDDHHDDSVDADMMDMMHEPVYDWVVPAPQEATQEAPQEECDDEMDEDFQPGSDDSLAATWLTPAQRESRRSPRDKTKRRTKIRRKEGMKRQERRTPCKVFLERFVAGHRHTAQVEWTKTNLAMLWRALRCSGSLDKFIRRNPELFAREQRRWIPTPQCIASVS